MSEVLEFDGQEICRWCDEVPPKGQPKTAVHVGTAVWSSACTNCATDRDNLMQPRGTR